MSCNEPSAIIYICTHVVYLRLIDSLLQLTTLYEMSKAGRKYISNCLESDSATCNRAKFNCWMKSLSSVVDLETMGLKISLEKEQEPDAVGDSAKCHLRLEVK